MGIFCTHCQHCSWSPEDGFAISLSLWLWGPRHGHANMHKIHYNSRLYLLRTVSTLYTCLLILPLFRCCLCIHFWKDYFTDFMVSWILQFFFPSSESCDVDLSIGDGLTCSVDLCIVFQSSFSVMVSIFSTERLLW